MRQALKPLAAIAVLGACSFIISWNLVHAGAAKTRKPAPAPAGSTDPYGPTRVSRDIHAPKFVQDTGKISFVVDAFAWNGPKAFVTPDATGVRLKAEVFMPGDEKMEGPVLATRYSAGVNLTTGQPYEERVPFTIQMSPNPDPYIVRVTLESTESVIYRDADGNDDLRRSTWGPRIVKAFVR